MADALFDSSGGVARLELFATAIRLRRTLARLTGAILLASLAAAALIHPLWESQSSLVILMGPEYGFRAKAGDPSAVNTVFDHDQIIGTEIAILSSRELHRAVLRDVGLQTVYPDYLDPGPIARAIGAIRSLPKQIMALAGAAAPALPDDPIEDALDEFDQNFGTLGEKEGFVVDVSFTHRDPEVARRVLATLEAEYLQRRQRLFADSQSAEVTAEVDRAQQDLQAADERLTIFKNGSGITNFSTRLDILLHEQGDTENDLKEAQSQSSQNAARAAALRGQVAQTPAEAVQSRDSEVDQRLTALRASLDSLRARRAELATQYRQDSEPLRAVDTQIAARAAELKSAAADRTPGTFRMAQNPVYVAVGTDQLRAQAELHAAQARVDRDTAQLAELAGQIAALDDHAMKLQTLERAVAVAEENYREVTRIRDARRVAEQVDAAAQGNARVLSPPSLPLRAKATRRLILISGVLLSAIAAAALVVVGNFRRRTFLFAASFERECGIAVLAAVPDTGGHGAYPVLPGRG